MVSGTNTFSGVAPGTPLTAETSAISGAPVSSVVLAGTDQINYATYDGRSCLEFILAGPGAGATRAFWATPETGRLVIGIRIPDLGNLPTNIEDFGGVRHADGNMTTWQIQDGKFQMQDATGTALTTGTNSSRAPENFPAVAGQSAWLEVEIRKGTTTTNGMLGYKYFIGDSTTPEHTWHSDAVNTGTADISHIFLGRSTGRTDARTYHLDTLRWESLPTPDTWIGLLSAAPAIPTASAGEDRTLEPFRTATVDCSNSQAAAGHGITEYEITQLSGPEVVLNGTGPLFTYPAPARMTNQELVFQVRVQDDTGQWSDPDTATHTVLHATKFLAGNPPKPIRSFRY